MQVSLKTGWLGSNLAPVLHVCLKSGYKVGKSPPQVAVTLIGGITAPIHPQQRSSSVSCLMLQGSYGTSARFTRLMPQSLPCDLQQPCRNSLIACSMGLRPWPAPFVVDMAYTVCVESSVRQPARYCSYLVPLSCQHICPIQHQRAGPPLMACRRDPVHAMVQSDGTLLSLALAPEIQIRCLILHHAYQFLVTPSRLHA